MLSGDHSGHDSRLPLELIVGRVEWVILGLVPLTSVSNLGLFGVLIVEYRGIRFGKGAGSVVTIIVKDVDVCRPLLFLLHLELTLSQSLVRATHRATIVIRGIILNSLVKVCLFCLIFLIFIKMRRGLSTLRYLVIVFYLLLDFSRNLRYLGVFKFRILLNGTILD